MRMNASESYFETVNQQLASIQRTQLPAIYEAGKQFAEALERGGWIYVFGTGHSHMIAEELFYRAGGLARVRPILCSSLMLHASASDSTVFERDPSVVDSLLDDYPIGQNDVLLIASNSGRNAVPVELAIRLRAAGIPVIALLNTRHSEGVDSRHASGKKLGDVAGLVIDNCGVEGDACVLVPGHPGAVGAASTVTGAMIVQMIACHTVALLAAKGSCPEAYCSSNAAGGDQNEVLLERYRGVIKHL